MAFWSLRATALAVAFHLAASLGWTAKTNRESSDDLEAGGGGAHHGGALKGFPAPEQIFRQYDRNRDGSLVGEELTALLKSLGFSPDESDQMRGEIDRNGDQLVSQKEFKNYLTNPLGVGEDSGAGEQADTAASSQAMQLSAKTAKGSQSQAAATPAAAAAGAAESLVLDESAAAPPALDTANAREASPQAAAHEGATVAPFGKDDTALDLQTMSSKAQDGLVDAIESAEVAEIKRSVFRALSRLRAAQLKEFDTIARLETQMIDDYNDNHHYRRENPATALAGQEDPVQADKTAAFH